MFSKFFIDRPIWHVFPKWLMKFHFLEPLYLLKAYLRKNKSVIQQYECRSAEDWMEIYRRLVSWELKLSDTASTMAEMLGMQKEEANQGFAKYIAKNYLDKRDTASVIVSH